MGMATEPLKKEHAAIETMLMRSWSVWKGSIFPAGLRPDSHKRLDHEFEKRR